MIENVLSQVWIQRLGWTLLHFLWQGTVIAMVYAVLRFLMRRTLSAQGRYVLACLALTAMAITPPVTFLLLPDETDTAGIISWNISSSAWQRILPCFVAVWMAGVFAFSIRLYGGWRFTARLRHASHPAPLEWQTALEDIAARVRTSRPVRLLVSPLVHVPTVIGWLRPVILVPVESLTGLPPELFTALLAHELAHIRRQDYLASILQSITEAVLFYHPAVWWISEQIRAEREACCDDLAVAASGDLLTYARALARLEAIQPLRLKPALSANGGSLVNRIRRLVEPAQPAADSLPGAGAAWAMTLLWMAGIGVATVHAAQTPVPLPHVVSLKAVSEYAPPSPFAAPKSPITSVIDHAKKTLLFDPFLSAQVAQAQDGGDAEKNALKSQYKQWLDADVAYIIQDEERKAFLQLATDEERAQFIEQFWLRRDPTPGTAENEYKAEHYRRVAYANEHFSSTIPGWKTDRGRVYITLGPPDEIEAHAQPYPVEFWRYRSIEGVGQNIEFEFSDAAGTGELRMSAGPNVLKMWPAFQSQAGFVGDPSQIPYRKWSDDGANTLPMKVHVDYLRGTETATIVNINLQIENRDLQFQATDGVDRAVVNLFGRVTSMTRRPITTFEPTLEINVLPGSAQNHTRQIFQQSVPLVPGRYQLLITAKDVSSGKVASYGIALDVPHFDEDKLISSSLILADDIEKLPAKPAGGGMFAIGDTKVRPRPADTFSTDEKMGVYLQVYNFTPDPATQKPNGSIRYEVDSLIDLTEEIAGIPNASASQVTIEKMLPLEKFAPGRHILKLTVTDRSGGRRIDMFRTSTVTAP
jgi:GWxTD domain-containing protein